MNADTLFIFRDPEAKKALAARVFILRSVEVKGERGIFLAVLTDRRRILTGVLSNCARCCKNAISCKIFFGVLLPLQCASAYVVSVCLFFFSQTVKFTVRVASKVFANPACKSPAHMPSKLR